MHAKVIVRDVKQISDYKPQSFEVNFDEKQPPVAKHLFYLTTGSKASMTNWNQIKKE